MRTRRLLGSLAILCILLGPAALPTAAQGQPYCDDGRAPRFVLGFAALKAHLGETMGDPVECEHGNPQNGDVLQQTTTGLAIYRELTNASLFTNGSEHWALIGDELVSWTDLDVTLPSPLAAAEAVARLQSAVQTQAAARARLRVLGDAFTCEEARFVSYRRSDAEPEVVDQWYVASQLWADVALLSAATPGSQLGSGDSLRDLSVRQPPAGWDEPEARCHVDKGFVFLDRLWDHTGGGYFPRSNPIGTDVSRGARYGDDNSLAGLALLATAETVPDGPLRRRYLHAARREADFLTEGGLWDDTFGGGFWWNTNKGDTLEGKPAQTNALAALFFARLYEATGVPAYRDWALRTLLWMDTVQFDHARQLYRWSVSYQEPAHRLGAAIHQRYFNYDQGIAIEAQLVANKLDGDPGRLVRARSVGEALHASFWGQERGGYNLEAGVEQVYPSYAAWASLGHLALFDFDHDARWLDMARSNADALAVALREPDGGYAYRHYRCGDRTAPGCDSGQGWVVDRTRDATAQAWPQHLQSAVAGRVNSPTPRSSSYCAEC